MRQKSVHCKVFCSIVEKWVGSFALLALKVRARKSNKILRDANKSSKAKRDWPGLFKCKLKLWRWGLSLASCSQ